MRKIVIAIVALMCSQAYGLSLMGPPMAELEQGQFGAGFDFSYSEADIKENSSTLEDVESLVYLARLGYGVADGWDLFVKLGITEMEYEDFDSGSDFAYGFGTKFTFSQQDSMSLGGLFQILWAEAEDTISGIKTEFDYYEIQIAVGPTFEIGGISVYGGPFLHFVDGDVKYKTLGSTDIEQDSEFGGYVGFNAELTENTNWRIEYQQTGDAYAFCTGISWKF